MTQDQIEAANVLLIILTGWAAYGAAKLRQAARAAHRSSNRAFKI